MGRGGGKVIAADEESDEHGYHQNGGRIGLRDNLVGCHMNKNSFGEQGTAVD